MHVYTLCFKKPIKKCGFIIAPTTESGKEVCVRVVLFWLFPQKSGTSNNHKNNCFDILS